MTQPESRLQKKIQDAITKRGGFVFKVHGSSHMMAGLPDLIACYRGLFVGVEVKMPGNKASKIQLLRHDSIKRAKGLVCVAYSVPEAMEMFDAIDTMLDTDLSLLE